MAVEIPVYVDIKSAFNQAAAEIPKEMPKLEKAISSAALKIDFGGDSLVRLLTDSSLGAARLNRGLHDIRNEFEAVISGAQKARKGMNVDNLIKSYALLEQRITGSFNQATVNIMKTEAAIAKATSKIQNLQATLAKETPGSDKFLKTNYEIGLQQKRIASLNRELLLFKAGVDTTNNSLSKQSGIVRQLTGYFSGLYAAHTVLRFVKQVRDVTGELEYQRVALGHLLQDVDYGNELFNRTVEAAKQSPFRITQLVTYTKQLAAYRIEQENLFDTTQRLADISAGLGVDMNRLILAYGQVRAASVLRGQELRQFTEAGIPLVDMLAEKFTELKGKMVSTADVFKLISERAVPFSMISEIFEDLTEKGGQFYKMQEQQALTLKGRWEKLKDAYDQALMSIGENDTFQRWNDVVLNVLNGIAKNLRGIVKAVNALSISWVAYKVATSQAVVNTTKMTAAMVKQVGWGMTLKSTIAGLSASFKKLVATLSANWVGLALSAIAGIITYFTTFRKKTEEAASGLESLEKAIEKMSEANKAFARAGTLITRYENLSKETERTANENLKLSQTMNRLKEQFPHLSNVIGDENIALSEQIELLKKANEARKEEAKQEATKELRLREKEYEDALKNINKAQEDYNKKYQKFLEAKASAEAGPQALVEGDIISVTTAKELDKTYSDADKAAIAAKEHLDEINATAEKLLGKITRLRNQIDPSVARKDWAEWQNQIKAVQDSLLVIGDSPVFTDEEIEGFSSVYDLSKKLKKRIDDLTTSIKGMKTQLSSMTDTTSASYQALSKEISASEKTLQIAEAIRLSLGLVFGKSSTSYTQDPFIKQMQDRIKFMKDFQKGYEDLSKYMSKSSALGKEAETMLTRGLSLGIESSEQRRAAEDLSKWYEDNINSTFDYLKKKKSVTGTLQEFLSKQITDTSNRGKMLKDFQSLLQSLFDAKTDLDTSKMKKNLEDQLKRIADEIKRSETARNFFNNILDMTGDQDLAANMTVSVYGDVGREFKENLQEQLNAALAHFDDGGNANLWDRMRVALGEGDFETIFRYMDKFPEEWQKRLKEMAESDQKYNAELAQNLLKTLEKAKSYGDQQVAIAQQTAKRIQDINSLDVSDDIKGRLLKQNAKKEAEETAKLQYEVFKDSPMYVELFANLDAASSKMLRNMRDNLIALKAEWKDLDPTQLKELQSRIDELEDQIAARNPFKALIESIKEYQALTKEQSRMAADETATGLTNYANSQKQALEIAKQDYQIAVEKYGITSDEARAAKEYLDIQAKETDEAIEQANKAQKTANAYRNAANHIANAAKKMQEWSEYVTTTLDGVGEIVATFASDDVSDTFNIISEGIGKTVGGVTNTAASAARVLTGDLTAIPSFVKGIGDVISGVFGTAQALRIKKIDKKIEDQQGLLAALEHSYDRLDKAMAKAFGSDYISNYNQQLANLAAQQEAYEEQARLESQKGKKKDEKKVEEYKQSASEVEEAIADMKGQLSEFFAGTDVASAAKEFSDAWIDAYKEFGSTTDAMKESFNDMIQNMITQSVGAKIMQTILQPLFDSIDQMASDGDLSASEIAQIGREAPEYIARINEGMSGLMTSLATAGYDVRQQTAGFTGISRNIAGATEESINGLAAGINTQNFYIPYVPTISENVAQILAVLSGNPSPKASPSSTTGINAPEYMQHLPSIDQNLATLLRKVDSVISPNSASTNTHYIAVR